MEEKRRDAAPPATRFATADSTASEPTSTHHRAGSVREEINRCYELINRLGRGVVYLGSSRMGPGHSHYVQAQELSKEARLPFWLPYDEKLLPCLRIANLLDCTSWSGAGPGLMNAVTQGALQAGKPVGRFKIGKEAGEWTASNYHPYLPSENYLTCRFFSAMKHGLVDVVVRNNSLDKTVVVALLQSSIIIVYFDSYIVVGHSRSSFVRRKACNMGSETPPDALSPSSTTCKQGFIGSKDLRWREVEKAIPLKKRRGDFDNNMEENISDSNRKKTNKIQSRSSRTKMTKMNMAWEQDDDEIIKDEEKEVEEEVVAVDEEGLIHGYFLSIWDDALLLPSTL
ncbi:hypothetical protein HN873_055569 [Arachis hypogaea]